VKERERSFPLRVRFFLLGCWGRGCAGFFLRGAPLRQPFSVFGGASRRVAPFFSAPDDRFVAVSPRRRFFFFGRGELFSRGLPPGLPPVPALRRLFWNGGPSLGRALPARTKATSPWWISLLLKLRPAFLMELVSSRRRGNSRFPLVLSRSARPFKVRQDVFSRRLRAFVAFPPPSTLSTSSGRFSKRFFFTRGGNVRLFALAPPGGRVCYKAFSTRAK